MRLYRAICSLIEAHATYWANRVDEPDLREVDMGSSVEFGIGFQPNELNMWREEENGECE